MMTLPLGIHHRDRDCRLMNAQPNSFSLLIEGAPFVGDHANDDNLLQKGRPPIMRLHRVITAVEFWAHCSRSDRYLAITRWAWDTWTPVTFRPSESPSQSGAWDRCRRLDFEIPGSCDPA